MPIRKFSKFMVCLFVICAILCACNGGSDSKRSQNFSGSLSWQYGIFGDRIGDGGMFISDLTHDGVPEIIISGQGISLELNQFFYVLHKDGNGYKQIWRSPGFEASFMRLRLIDANNDHIPDIVVALNDGRIFIYSGIDFKQIAAYQTEVSLLDADAADLDGDGTLELVTSSFGNIYIYSLIDGHLKWQKPNCGGLTIAIGNVDSDPALEIVTSSFASPGFVVDGISGQVEWETQNSFGSRIAIGDLNGDGIQEIVGSGGFDIPGIQVFDAVQHVLSWQITGPQDVNSLAVTDITGDDKPEIIYGDGQWDGLHAYDASTQEEIWTIQNPGHGITGFAWGDTDGDGVKKVVWGSSLITGWELYIARADTQQITWQNDVLGGPLNAVDVGDVDGDGENEIILIPFRNQWDLDVNSIHCFNAKTHALKWKTSLGTQNAGGVRSVKIADVDADGRKDIVVTTSDEYQGLIRVFDGVTHQLKMESPKYEGQSFTALAIGDIDGDGQVEIVAGQTLETSAADGIYLIVFDGKTLQEKWRTPQLTNGSWQGVYDIKLDGLDGLGRRKIIASIPGGAGIVVFDGVSHQELWRHSTPAYAIETANTDGFPGNEILIGREDGALEVYDGVEFKLLKTTDSPSPDPIYAMRFIGTETDIQPNLLIASGSSLYGVNYKTPSQPIWQQNQLGDRLAWQNQLVVTDVGNDSILDVFLGSGLSLYQFEFK